MARFADLVATSESVAATPARSAKVAALAARITALAADGPEVVAAGVSFLTGEPRQGRIGVGSASLGRVLDPGPAPGVTEPVLTVTEVDAALGRLAALGGAGSQAARAAALGGLLARATGPEAAFLRSALTGGVRQGALAGVVTEAVAEAAGVPLAVVRRAAMLAGDLPRVAAVALCSGRDALEAIGLQPLRAAAPMLASTSGSVAEAMAALGQGARASIEWKLDGARVQAHRSGDEVRLFTRNLNDVTARLPGVVEVVRSLPVRSSVVLDGEVIGLGLDGDRPDPFQETMSRFGRSTSAPPAAGGLVVRFFDVLHVDGDDLIDRPLTDRLVVLERVAGPWRVPGLVTASVDEASAFEASALAAGHEGVMVKSATSSYEAGRRGAAWRKVKPVRTLDLVVLGAEWGHGRRQGWLSNLHLGAAVPPSGGHFVMVGKTFKGLTDSLLAWQTDQLLAREVRRQGITVFVRPELVVEVGLDGVQRSTRYPGGVALRFARVKGYRPDKTAAEADTIDAVRSLVTGGEG
ncbi:MAG TPA: ATP-dependent DNA ligase [Acidimicrobiales bacterium]|nr:ATP-dependent DNA ligase [Acidimicrobiales bacterium]